MEKYPVWREYRDQKHDLFITDRPTAGYLTGIVLAVGFNFCILSSCIIQRVVKLVGVVRCESNWVGMMKAGVFCVTVCYVDVHRAVPP